MNSDELLVYETNRSFDSSINNNNHHLKEPASVTIDDDGRSCDQVVSNVIQNYPNVYFRPTYSESNLNSCINDIGKCGHCFN